MAFKKGVPRLPNAGRRLGTPNKRTTQIRAMLHGAARRIGGINRLVEWIKEDPHNERVFWAHMYMKMLPVRIDGEGPHGEIEMTLKIAPEELRRRLEERGLPKFVFGDDKPILELTVNKSKGGQGNGGA